MDQCTGPQRVESVGVVECVGVDCAQRGSLSRARAPEVAAVDVVAARCGVTIRLGGVSRWGPTAG